MLRALGSTALRDVFNDQQQFRTIRFGMTNLSGIQRHHAMADLWKLVLNLESLHRGMARDHILQETSKRRDVPLAVAEVKEQTAGSLVRQDFEGQRE